MLNIAITKTSAPKDKPEPCGLGFGKFFTDHMFVMEFGAEKGWQNPRIVPFADRIVRIEDGRIVGEESAAHGALEMRRGA